MPEKIVKSVIFILLLGLIVIGVGDGLGFINAGKVSEAVPEKKEKPDDVLNFDEKLKGIQKKIEEKMKSPDDKIIWDDEEQNKAEESKADDRSSNDSGKGFHRTKKENATILGSDAVKKFDEQIYLESKYKVRNGSLKLDLTDAIFEEDSVLNLDFKSSKISILVPENINIAVDKLCFEDSQIENTHENSDNNGICLTIKLKSKNTHIEIL